MNSLHTLLRESADKFLNKAIELEFDHFLRQFSGKRGEDGLSSVVRNGYQPEREVMTGIGPVPVRIPKIRVRHGRPLAFHSALVPAYLRRTCVRNVTPSPVGLYLHSIFAGDCCEALDALVGSRPLHIPVALWRDLESLWRRQWDGRFDTSLRGESITELCVDSVHVGFRDERARQCMLVAIGVAGDGSRKLLATRECSNNARDSWFDMLSGLQARGVAAPAEVVASRRAVGLAPALANVFDVSGIRVREGQVLDDEVGVEAAFDHFLESMACPTRCPVCGDGSHPEEIDRAVRPMWLQRGRTMA